MTMPRERTNSVMMTRQFLLDLMRPSKTPRVPKATREMARYLLKHFPGNYELLAAAEKVPDLWANPYKMLESKK